MEGELYEKIGRYVEGEMQGEELKEFEDQMQIDGTLREKVDVFSSVEQALSGRFQNDTNEQGFNNQIARLAGAHIVEDAEKPSKIKWFLWAAAASVILLAVIFFSTPSSEPTYADYAVYEPLALAERGDTDSVKLLAESAFNGKEYEKALRYVDAILREDMENTSLQIYKAIALIELGRYDEADDLLNSIERRDSLYRDKAIWWQALSALKQREYDRSKALLIRISEDADEYKRAQTLLDEL